LLQERNLEPSRDVYLVNSFNRFEASRFGFSGNMVDVSTGTASTIAKDMLTTLRTVAPQAKALRLTGILDEIGAVVDRGQTDADWLRSHSRDSGEDSRSLQDVVRAACDAWAH
jgi:glutamate---cysteine ligase / carboxylate-amine ligase